MKKDEKSQKTEQKQPRWRLSSLHANSWKAGKAGAQLARQHQPSSVVIHQSVLRWETSERENLGDAWWQFEVKFATSQQR